MQKLEKQQQLFWQHAWKKTSDKNELKAGKPDITKIEHSDSNKLIIEGEQHESKVIVLPKKCSKRIKKPRKKVEHRTWRTRKDPFENVIDQLRLRLELDPHVTVKSLLEELISKFPNDFHHGQLRTLQRRVRDWRKEQC